MSTDDQAARAKELIAARDYVEAVRVCRRALLTKPEDVEVRLLLGDALLALGRYDEVRAEMLALARRAPSSAKVQRILGEALLRAGQTERAVESLTRAAQLDPEDEAVRELLAEAGEEPRPQAGTLDRWFDPDAAATIEQSLPEFEEEEHTGPIPRVPGLTTGPVAPGTAASPPKADSLPAATRVVRGGVPATSPLPGAHKASVIVADDASTVELSRRAPPREATAELDLSEAERVHGPGDSVTSELSLLDLGGAESSAEITAPRDALEEEEEDETDVRGLAKKAPAQSAPVSPLAPPRSVPPPGRSVPPPRGSVPAPPGRSVPPPARPVSVPAPPGGRPASVPPPGRPASMRPPAAAALAAARPVSVPPPRSVPPPSAAALRSPPAPAFPEDAVGGAFPSDGIPRPAHATAVVAAVSAAAAAQVAAPAPVVAAAPMPRPAPVSPAAVPPPTSGVPRATLPRAWLVAAGGLVLVAGLVAAVAVGATLLGDSAADEAVLAAEDLGTSSAFRAALTASEGQGARHARLRMTTALEDGTPLPEALAEVGALDASAAQSDEGRLASVWTLLGRGESGTARRLADALAASSGEASAEVHHVRALAALASADVPGAAREARTAAALRPAAPRHLALAALVRARSGDLAGALGELDRVPGGAVSPRVRATRARLLVARGAPGDVAAAQSEAQTVLGPLGADASKSDAAWAHLVLAAAALERGSRSDALSEAHTALAARPPADEAFLLALAEIFMRAEVLDEATAALTLLPAQPSEPSWAGALRAELALAAGRVDEADALLGPSTGARAELARGRVAEARGQRDEAARLYESAARDPQLFGRARVRAARLALARGAAREAAGLAEDARRFAPADPDVVAVAVDARLAIGDVAGAETVLRIALESAPDAPHLLVARGSVELAKNDPRAALTTLQRAAEVAPSDAQVRVTLARAAHLAGDDAAAQAALGDAMRLAPELPAALLGLAELAAERNDADAARGYLDRADRVAPGDVAVVRVRARVLVQLGAGAEGVAMLGAATTSTDAPTLAALGELASQAERDADAGAAFNAALRLDASEPDALLGRVRLELRRGNLSAAARGIGVAERALTGAAASTTRLARLDALRARLRFEYGRFDSAAELVSASLQRDPRCADANLLRAQLAQEHGEDPQPSLRLAISGHAPPPEAVGRLAIALGPTQEGCALARRYVLAAPTGYDAEAVRRVAEACP